MHGYSNRVRRSYAKTTITFLVLSIGVIAAGQASAAGISSARFGGEHGHPTTDNATAIYYNPAGLALSRGTHIFLDANLALRSLEYDRPESAVSNPGLSDLNVAANSGKSSLFNPIVAPFAGVSSDFGTDFIAAGVAWYYPFGGSAVWDENSKYKNTDAPGAVDGTQRWYSIDGTIRSMYITGAVALQIREIDLSIGVSGSVIRSEVNTIRARNADGTDDIQTGGDAPQLKEGRSKIDVSGWTGGFGIGLIWQPVRDMVWIGASYSSQPGVDGGETMEGELENVLGTGPSAITKVEMTQNLPDIIRVGARVRPTPDSEIRLFADYTRWSLFDKQCVLDKSISGRKCGFSGYDTALDNPESFGKDGDVKGVTQHLPRMWRDSVGVRLGGSYWFIPELEGVLGAGYDSSAIPPETIDPALVDMDKVTLSAGLRWQAIENLAINFAYTQVLYFELDTDGKNQLNTYQAPTKQPSGEGVYSQSLSLFNLSLDISF